MALETSGVDPGAVSTILNRLKSQGIFDQFRRDCLADVDTKPAYQNLRQRVESYVSNFLSHFTWTPEMNKNQLRDRLRRQINQSDMLASGVDRIIEQVVEPKMQHVFRPQIEKVVNQYLHSETVNGEGEIPKKNGTVLNDHPPVNTTEVPLMTPPEEMVFSKSPDVPSPPPEQPPLPPTPAVDDEEKMPPPPQPPPPPLPPSEELVVNTEDPALLPSPAFEPIGSSPPHPGASFLNKEFVDSPIPEPLSDGSPEQMDFSQSPDSDSVRRKTLPDPTDVKGLLARTVLAKKAGRSTEGDITSPQTSDASPLSDGRSSLASERKADGKQADWKKGTKNAERDTSSSPKPKTKIGESQKLASEASSPGTWSTKSSMSLPKTSRKEKPEESPGSLSTPSTPEKAVKSDYERKMEIKRKVENLIKQNIKIRDKRDSSDSSGGDSSPDIRYRGESEHRRMGTTPSPLDRHRKDHRSAEKKSRNKRSWEQVVRPEDALRAISPEVISDEELEKKSVKDTSDVERSEGELVSSDEDGKKEKELADLGNLSDITVSSVHTSDLSSFSDVSSSSSTSGSDVEEDRKAKDSTGPTTNLKSIPKQYQARPPGFPPHFDSSEDEAQREERKKRAALAKEERVKRRQLQKEEKEKMLRIAKSKDRENKETEEKPSEKSKIDDDLSPVSTDTDSRDEMGDSPEPKEATADDAKPVKKRRRSSEEDKPQVEFFPAYVSSTSSRKRRQASVKDSFLLTQKISGAKLLRRRKKKMNNRSGSKLFFRMGGQSGGSTPKRSDSPRMGGSTASEAEGQLVSKLVANLGETQEVTSALRSPQESGQLQGNVELERAAIIPVLNKYASFTSDSGAADTNAGVPLLPKNEEEGHHHQHSMVSQELESKNYKDTSDRSTAAFSQVSSSSSNLNITQIPGDDKTGSKENSIRSKTDQEDAGDRSIAVEPDVLRDEDMSSGPATPLMDETEDQSAEKFDEGKSSSPKMEDVSSEESTEWEPRADRDEDYQEKEASEKRLSPDGEIMIEKMQEESVEDVSDGSISERKDELYETSELSVSEVNIEEAQPRTDNEDPLNIENIDDNNSSDGLSEDEAVVERDEQKETEEAAETPGSSELMDKCRDETSYTHQVEIKETTSRSESPKADTKTAIHEQKCMVVLHDIQTSGRSLSRSHELPSEEGRVVLADEEGLLVRGSWAEDVEDGVVVVHDEVVNQEVEEENPPTPTQDELIDSINPSCSPPAEEGEQEGTMEEEEEEVQGKVGKKTSLGTQRDEEEEYGDASEMAMSTAEESSLAETSRIISGEEASQGSILMTDQADSRPPGEVTVGRRSRRSVSDRHSKDEDFVYFGIRRKSRQKSQSPTPSLQSNESESSHTSTRSSRSSRRNSGRSVEMEEKKTEVVLPVRVRHASQELPSTSASEDRPKRSRRGSPPNRYSPSESATRRLTKRKQSPSPTPQSQAVPSRRTSKREHYTRHSTSSNRDSDFIYEMPKRRSDRHSTEERPNKRKR